MLHSQSPSHDRPPNVLRSLLSMRKVLMSAFGVVTPRCLVRRYKRFGGESCLHLQGYLQVRTVL
jgi:hypothetical protein